MEYRENCLTYQEYVSLRRSVGWNGAYARVILKGYADTVMEILNAYYS